MQPSCEAVDLSSSFSDFIIVRFTKDEDFLQTQTELFLYSLSATAASFKIAIMLEKVVMLLVLVMNSLIKQKAPYASFAVFLASSG